MAAHRLSTVQAADHIVVLAAGLAPEYTDTSCTLGSFLMMSRLAVAAATVPFLLAAASSRLDVDRWAPPRVSTEMFESHAAFDPRTGELWFVRSKPDFTGWRLMVSSCTAAGWSTPIDAPIAGDGAEADPWFTPDGNSLYFISTRSTDGIRRKDLDIWRADRDASGKWGSPQRLPAPINSTSTEWYPRLAPDGWLYFGSNRPGGIGQTDIYRAKADARGTWTVENVGPALNAKGNQYEALPSPDNQTLILMADDGLYESHRTAEGWSPRTKLPAQVNTTGTEIGALWSPSGKSLLFARDTKGKASGEFFVWHREGHEAWPPACPPTQ